MTMEWLAFSRAVAAFAGFYFILPTLVRGRKDLRSPYGWTSAFVRFSLFLELSILLLGIAHLALPGAVAALCAVWLGLDAVQRAALPRQGLSAHRSRLAHLLSSWRDGTFLLRPSTLRSWPRQWKAALLPCLFVGMALAARAWFPLHNLRLADADSYARALSLAVLSSGHDWRPDASIPLLLPLHHLASLTAPRTLAFSAPLFTALLVGAVGIAAYSLAPRRLSAIAAISFASLATLFQIQQGPYAIRAEMGAVYLVLAVALWRRRKLDAWSAVLLGGAVSPSPELLHVLAPYLACVGIGVSTAHLGWGRDACAKLAVGAASACILLLGPRLLAKGRPEGPLQYEEAAMLVDRMAKDLPRNSWTLVSQAHELPYIYGRGWHADIAQFVAEADLTAARKPSYRIPFPVRDVYFLVETRPLNHGPFGFSSRDRLTRASYEFQLAEWLAAYRAGHDDLATVYQGENIAILRAPGNLVMVSTNEGL